MNKSVKERMLIHESLFNEYACKSSESIRFEDIDEDIRSSYFRDIDRILHSNSYIRYMGKTQVFTNKLNDHITSRATHVQFVSKISRTIARALGLNEDLCEAMAIGHDLGHVPFGHEGERILNKLSIEVLNERFKHNIQSVRDLMYVEKEGKGLNISVQVLDGIMCHNGELVEDMYKPVNKTKEMFLKEYNDSYIKDVKLIPMTLEGCVVRISDIIAYIGRDIEDYEMLYNKDLKLDENISKVLGSNNTEIINNIILDVVENSYNKEYISMSKEVYETLFKLKKFNYDNIYSKAITDKERDYYKDIFYTLYYKYLKDFNNKNSRIYNIFLKDKSKEYLESFSKERIIIDYLAGMTDRYIINEYNNVIGGKS